MHGPPCPWLGADWSFAEAGGHRADIRPGGGGRGHRRRLSGLQPAEAGLHGLDPRGGPPGCRGQRPHGLQRRRLPQPVDHAHQPAALHQGHRDPQALPGRHGRGLRFPPERLPLHLLRRKLGQNPPGRRDLGLQRRELRTLDAGADRGSHPRPALRSGPHRSRSLRVPGLPAHRGRRLRQGLRRLRPQPGGGGLLRTGWRFPEPARDPAPNRSPEGLLRCIRTRHRRGAEGCQRNGGNGPGGPRGPLHGPLDQRAHGPLRAARSPPGAHH
ncbi:MAG: hypothetical protein BWY56_00417 [Acidobacteria bacterium ADurb.Bin340]|nr:MAG: hypothetical protein BWY56_00417 [Acidobacteria bacterium ADurb.Bin340]